MKKVTLTYILFFLCFPSVVFAAKLENKDSIIRLLPAIKNDSLYAYTANHIAFLFLRSDTDSCMIFLAEARKRASVKNIRTELSRGYTLEGRINYLNGRTDSALVYYSKALHLDTLLNRIEDASADHVHISKAYSLKGNIDKALDHLRKALQLAKDGGFKEQEADCLFALAVLYDRMDEPSKAITFCENAVVIQKQIGDSSGLAYSYHRMGLAYEGLGKYDEALRFLELSLEIRQKMKAEAQYGAPLNGIGLVYMDKKEYQLALKKFYDAYKYWSAANDKEGMVIATGNLGELSKRMGDNENALRYLLQSYQLADEIHAISFQKGTAHALAEIYYEKGNYKLAYDYYNKYSSLRDTLFSEENSQRMAEMQSRYESEQKEQQINLLTKEKELQNSELSKKRFMLNALGVGGILLLVLVFMAFRNIRQKKKANSKLSAAYSEIEHKNEKLVDVYHVLEQNRDEIAGKNKEITDSIKYAKRLQEAILPSKDFIQSLFPSSFVMYKPKDIVSGDFYWFERSGNKKLFAAVDCTGHGVPGAFMSIVGYNQLNQAVNENGLSKPNLILNALNKGITSSLKQTEEGSTVKDGMDIALCSLDETTNTLEFSGAYNPLWLVRDGTMTELKGDKKPIGVFVGEEMQAFSSQEIHLQKGDSLYIFTDGYADQFGGQRGKKFKYKQLQELILSISMKTMEEQRNILDKTIEEWKGELEQIDDILVMGIRI